MRGSRHDYLFFEESLEDRLRMGLSAADGQIDQIAEDQFLASTDDQIAEHVKSSCVLLPLTLHEELAGLEQNETQVDVSNDQNRIFFPGTSGPVFVPGTAVTIKIPFTGNCWIWKYRTNPYSLSFPTGTI